MKLDATISEDQIYRYWLRREFDENNKNILLFIMLNPSKADATINDPTITRCISFAKREGCGALEVVNLYAFRATDPKILLKQSSNIAIGPENLKYISLAAKNAYKVICGWGNNAKDQKVINDTLAEIKKYHEKIYCFKISKQGNPFHPLYLKNEQPLMEFE